MASGESCTRKGCHADAASDSVQCPKHRDQQRAANARFQGRPLVLAPSAQSKAVQKVAQGGARHTRMPARVTAISNGTLRTVNQPAGDCARFVEINRVMHQLQDDLDTLARTKAILMQHTQATA